MKRMTIGQDEEITLNVNGVDQRLRIRAARAGLPPLLIIQGGPGLPLLNEVPRLSAALSLEDDFTVAYWDQRGCGDVEREAADSDSLSLGQLLEDLCCVIRQLHEKLDEKILLLGISLGGSLAMQAASREGAILRAVVAISPDLNVAMADDNAYRFLIEASKREGGERTSRLLARLGPPPYLSPARFQQRLRLLADFGSIERSRKFGRMAAALALSLIRRYGPAGTATALRNAASIHARLLPALAELDLLSSWPESAVPIHLVFGEDDLLSPPSLVRAAALHIRPGDSLTVLPGAGHMAHFDRPAAVRDLVRSLGP